MTYRTDHHHSTNHVKNVESYALNILKIESNESWIEFLIMNLAMFLFLSSSVYILEMMDTNDTCNKTCFNNSFVNIVAVMEGVVRLG